MRAVERCLAGAEASRGPGAPISEGEQRLRAVVARAHRLEAELREIQRISAPDKAWPYERVTAALEGDLPSRPSGGKM